MSRKKLHKKSVLPLPVKIAVWAVLCLVLLSVTLYAVSAAVIRNLDAGARELLCGTMAERELFCTDWFFTSDEIAHATADTSPDAALPTGGTDASAPLPESDAYVARVYEISSDGISLSAGAAGTDGVRIGLAEYPGMVYADGTLSHTGETDYQRFRFCGMTADGTLRICTQNPVEAVNAGYVWGFTCARVLVSGGIPCADLRGGYGMRAAIGQRADGSLFLLIAEEKTDKLYPRGITYDGLAYLCAREGAVVAAALPVAGKTAADGKTLGQAPGKAGYHLTASASAN